MMPSRVNTPRKRPAPSPERIAHMLATRRKPKAKPTKVVHATEPTLLERIVGDIDAEIDRLRAARRTLLELAGEVVT